MTQLSMKDRRPSDPKAREDVEFIAGLVLIGVLCGGAVAFATRLLDSHGSLSRGLWAGVGVVVAGLLLRAWRRWLARRGRLVTDRACPDLRQPSRGPRNHVICLDGTWNAADVPANVWKLFERFPKDSDAQIARYYPGVGTRELPGARSDFVKRHFRKKTFEGVTAYGARGALGLLQRAYFDFVKDYRPGDRIYIFGFSRGAAAARALANYICETYGLPAAVEIEYLKSHIQDDVVTGLTVVPAETASSKPKVAFLGLWDTVGAMGNPLDKREPFDLTIPPGVDKVVHLVAIDEQRRPFDVALIDADDRVEEVWFPGAHGNVGGGLENCTLSDIALNFMINRANEAGVSFREGAPTLRYDLVGVSREALWDCGWPESLRMIRKVQIQGREADGRPRIHKSAFILKDAGIDSGLSNIPEHYDRDDRD